MKINNLFLFMAVFMVSGCYMGAKTYEVFERNLNHNVGSSFIPSQNKKLRKIYDESRYEYVMHGSEGCVYRYFTNRDDKKEKVIGWEIISGKEYCKEQQAYSLIQ